MTCRKSCNESFGQVFQHGSFCQAFFKHVFCCLCLDCVYGFAQKCALMWVSTPTETVIYIQKRLYHFDTTSLLLMKRLYRLCLLVGNEMFPQSVMTAFESVNVRDCPFGRITFFVTPSGDMIFITNLPSVCFHSTETVPKRVGTFPQA